MAGNQLYVRLWGVRGSYPVPGPSSAQFGGNTSCVEIRAGSHIVILDGGTGIIELGQKLIKERNKQADKSLNINLFFSHTHHDHLQGFPYFAPAFHDNCTINCYGPKSFSQDLQEILKVNMAPQYSPIELNELNSELLFHNVNENNIVILTENSAKPELTTRSRLPNVAPDAVAVSLLRNYAHPKIGTFVIKVAINGKSVVYATDIEGYVGGDTRLARFARNANLLIHDAQYTPEQYLETQGFGHSTYEMAAKVAAAAQVKQLVLFHHDPTHDDAKLTQMQKAAKQLFPATTMGAEGLEFEF